MLDAGGNRIRPGEIVLLIALDPGAGQSRTQIGVFATGLDNASPAWVAGDVHHGRKNPRNAVGARFSGAKMSHRLGCRGIPGSRHGQGYGKCGAVAVNDVQTEKNRNVKAGFFESNVLVVVGRLSAHHIQHRTHLALGRQFVIVQIGGAGAGGVAGRILRQLADLLLKRHLLEERIDARIQVSRRQLGIRRHPGLGSDAKQAGTGKQDQETEQKETMPRAEERIFHANAMINRFNPGVS